MTIAVCRRDVPDASFARSRATPHRMLEPGLGPRLAQKARDRVGRRIAVPPLDRDLAADVGVGRRAHLAHPAAPDHRTRL